MDNPLLSGAVIAAALVGGASILNQALNSLTSRRSNQINTDRLAFEKETKQREIEEARREELRSERDTAEARCKELEVLLLAAERKITVMEARCAAHEHPCERPLTAAPILISIPPKEPKEKEP